MGELREKLIEIKWTKYKLGSLSDLSTLEYDKHYIIIQKNQGPGVVDSDFSVKRCEYKGKDGAVRSAGYLSFSDGQMRFNLEEVEYGKSWLVLDVGYCEVDNPEMKGWQDLIKDYLKENPEIQKAIEDLIDKGKLVDPKSPPMNPYPGGVKDPYPVNPYPGNPWPQPSPWKPINPWQPIGPANPFDPICPPCSGSGSSGWIKIGDTTDNTSGNIIIGGGSTTGGSINIKPLTISGCNYDIKYNYSYSSNTAGIKIESW